MSEGGGGESKFIGLEKKLSTSVDVSRFNMVHYISRLLDSRNDERGHRELVEITCCKDDGCCGIL